MAFTDVFSSIASGLISPITNYFDDKQKLAAAATTQKLQLQQATADRQCELIKQGLAADAAWEMASITAGQSSRNFELWVVSAPLILCFFPTGAKWVKDGFQALAGTPGWFQTLVVTIFLANYGIRLWRRNLSSDT